MLHYVHLQWITTSVYNKLIYGNFVAKHESRGILIFLFSIYHPDPCVKYSHNTGFSVVTA
jgi:hypothetical protein